MPTPILQALVHLPGNFQGNYHPQSVEEFRELAKSLLNEPMGDPQRNSSYALVSVCIGMDICELSEKNQQHYAEQNGYDTLVLKAPVEGVPPKMLKYLLLSWVMDRGYDWLLMIDADALITNYNITFQLLLEEFQPSEDTSLIATRGGNWKTTHALNNGVFLLKNSDWSLNHCYQIFTAKWSYTRFLGKTLVDQPIQMSLLLAQNELTWPPQFEEERGKHVMIVKKRKINSFRRDDTHSAHDNSEGGQWERGDFIAHFASGNKYSLMLSLMEQEGMPGIPSIENRYPFPIPLPGEETTAGNCWLDDNDQLRCMPKYHVIGVHNAGTKAIMRFLGGHPGLDHTPYVDDPARWLTDSARGIDGEKCKKLRRESLLLTTGHNNTKSSRDGNGSLQMEERPVFLAKKMSPRGTQRISTCSFKDYTLLHGQHRVTPRYDRKEQLPTGTESSSSQPFTSSNPPSLATDNDGRSLNALDNNRPMFDELSIWDKTFHEIRGTGLPELLQRLQPSANLLITVKSSVEVFYSIYNHVYDIGGRDDAGGVGNDHTNVKGPRHFDDLARELTNEWVSKNCTAANHMTCLPKNLVEPGSWLSRTMYSQYLPRWLDQFGCSKMHLFDVSEDTFQAVNSLYDFMGVPELDVASQVTNEGHSYSLVRQGGGANREESKSGEAPVTNGASLQQLNVHTNKSYEPMLAATKFHLEEFFSSYYAEMCSLMVKYPCLRVPLFLQHCDGPSAFTK